LAKRPLKTRRQLGGDLKNLVKFNFRPREILIPSKKNEQMTAEFIFDVGSSVRRALRKRKRR